MAICFPDVSSTDVERAFDDVRGVARPVVDMNQLEVLKRKMMSTARKVNLDLLRDPVESDQKPSFDTEGIGDALFYIVQGGTNVFGRCAVTVGRYATELIYQAVFERGRCLKKLCRSLTVTQYFERRLEHLLGVMCFKSLHAG